MADELVYHGAFRRQTLEAMVAAVQQIAEGPKLELPVLWLHGELDQLAPYDVTREAAERIEAAGAHIVGVTLTKSAEEASHYGYRLYQYTAVGDKRNQIVLIPQQAEG